MNIIIILVSLYAAIVGIMETVQEVREWKS